MIKSRRMRWMGHVVLLEDMRNGYKIVVGKPEGKRPLLISKYIWEDNIKIDLKEIGLEVVDWIDLTWDRDLW
jgi:hypothetical protein